MENNPLYAFCVAICAVLLLFFIIIGNLWTIESRHYSMSNPHEGYLADENGNFEFTQTEFYTTQNPVPPDSKNIIDWKIVSTYGTRQINTQTWDYNYDTETYQIIGYKEIRTPKDKYVDSENRTHPVYILNQDVNNPADLFIYVDNSILPRSAFSLADVTTRLSEDLETDNTTIRVDSAEYFLVQNEEEDELTFTIGNERIDCETKTNNEFRNCKRGIDSTAPSTHSEESLVIQPGQRNLTLNNVVYSGEIVEVRYPIEYYYESVINPGIPDTINDVDLSDYNTTYGEYNIFSGEEASMAKTAADIHFLINLAQLMFTIAMFMLLCLYFKIKIQFINPEFFKTGALLFCVLSILLAVATGIIFFNNWPGAYEEDTKLFGENDLKESIWGSGRYEETRIHSKYTFDRCTQERTVTDSSYYYLNGGQPNTDTNCNVETVIFYEDVYIEYEWKLTWNWFLITFLIPLLGLGCLFLTYDLDVDGYYSSTSSIDSIDEFMTIPDHDDGYHVSFAEALGYGFSVLANWISYIVAIAAINIVFFLIITWVLLRGTYSSFVIAAVLGFVGFLLNAALLMAVLYKYQSDVNMKTSESIVNEGLRAGALSPKQVPNYQQTIPNATLASVLENTESKTQKTKKRKGKKGTKTNPETPQTQEEFDAVPVGIYYVNPSDDTIYKKE